MWMSKKKTLEANDTRSILWIPNVWQKSPKVMFSQKAMFWWKNIKSKSKNMMKPKMVPMVHRNIVYSVDWGIRDSKIVFLRKSEHLHFQKWGLKIESLGLGGGQNCVFGGVFETKHVLKYPGLIRHHPGSIPIYKIIIFKKNQTLNK